MADFEKKETIDTILEESENLLDSGEVERAIAHLESAMEIYPKNKSIAILLGEAYLCTGEPQKAIHPLRWALELDVEEDHTPENNWEIYYLLGSAFARIRKYKKALFCLDKANEKEPNNSEILRNIGWILCMQKKTLAGRAILRRSISLDQKNALAYNDLGASYMFDGDFDEASKWIKQAHEIDPEDLNIMETQDKLSELQSLNRIFPKRRRARKRSTENCESNEKKTH